MSAELNHITRRLGGVPPDPDNMNVTRARQAEVTLRFFCAEAFTDDENALADFITSALHWCDRNDLDFDAELARGRANYLNDTRTDE